jgi:hypothetical protein
VRYIVSRFASELFCGDVDALGDGMQSGTVCIDGGEVAVVVEDAASLSLEPLPQPARAKARTTITASRDMVSSLLSLEPAFYLPELEQIDLDHLRAAALSAHDPHRAGRNLEHRSEQADDRLVRTPALRWSCHAHLPTLSVPSDELGPRRARRDRDTNPSR